MKKLFRGVKLALPTLLTAFALFISCDLELFLAVILAVVVHEFGHLTAAALLNADIKRVKLSLLGARIEATDPYMTYCDELILCACGPLANIYSLMLLLPPVVFGRTLPHFCAAFGISSLMLCALNLLPVLSFDGGRILYCLIAHSFGPYAALRVLSFTSFVCVGALWLISVYVLLISQACLAVFVFSVALFVKTFVLKESDGA